MDSFDLSGKVALVTGAAHGIGFSIGCALARQGATLCFNCSSKGSYERGKAAYEKEGIDTHGFVCDVSDEVAVTAMIASISYKTPIATLKELDAHGLIHRERYL